MINIRIKSMLLNIRNIFYRNPVLWIFACVGVILLAHNFLNLVVVLGRNIPVAPGMDKYAPGNEVFPLHRLKVDYICGLIWGIALGISIFIWPIREKDKKAVLIAWSIKLFVVLFLMLFYEWHYSGLDSYGYYNATFFKRSDWYSMEIRSTIYVMVNLIWWHLQVIPSFHAVKVSFAMVGLVAIYVLYRALVIFLKEEKIIVFYMFVFFPSILFWSSILGKEPISLLGMALYAYGALGWHCRRRLAYLLALALGIMISMYLRAWFGLILFLPFAVLFFLGLKKSGKILFVLLVLNFIIVFKSMIIKIFQPQNLDRLVKVANHMSHGFDAGGSAVGAHREFLNIGQMLLYVPKGLFTALFRPLPGELDNTFGFLASVEDYLILLILLAAISKIRLRHLREPVFIWAILLILSWGSIYAFLAYNLGTISRYRLQIMPILLGVILYLLKKTRNRAGC